MGNLNHYGLYCNYSNLNWIERLVNQYLLENLSSQMLEVYMYLVVITGKKPIPDCQRAELYKCCNPANFDVI
jgi:hypothetical protein